MAYESMKELEHIQGMCLRYPLLSRDEELALAQKTKQMGEDGLRARQDFVNHNLRLVLTFVRARSKFWDLSPTDAFQEGCIGLQRAVEKYDPTLGWRFGTYAVYWIKQAITQSVRKSETIRVPNGVWEDVRALRAGRVLPTKGRLERALNFQRTSLTLDETEPTKKDLYINMVLDEKIVPPDVVMERAELVQQLKNLPLRERDKEITLLWLEDDRTLESLGEQFHLSKERCRQLVDKVLNELRRNQ